MGGSPFLGLRVANGVTPTAIFYNNPQSFFALGNTFGVLDTSTSAADQPVNRIIYFTGNNIYGPSGGNGALYASVGNNIYRSLDDGNTWVVATALTSNITSNNAVKSGLNIVTGPDGLQRLCLIYWNVNALAIRGMSTVDGYTWTSHGPYTVTTGGQGYTQDTVLGGVLYCLSAEAVLLYDPGIGLLSSVPKASAAESLSRAAMCVWNNSIYIAGYNTTSGARPLYRIGGGLLVNVKNLATEGTSATTTNKLGMLVDGSNLYVFSLQVAASTGWACYQVDTPGTYNVTKLTSVISGSMAVQGASGPGPDSRVLTYVDGDSTPGTNPPKYVFYAANGTSSTQFEQFQWNGPNAPMTSIATGGDVTHALTVSKRSSSNGVPPGWATAIPYIISSGPTTSGTVGWRVNFTLWGNLAADRAHAHGHWVLPYWIRIRLWYGGYDDEYQTQVGTLADPAVSAVPGTPGPVAPNGTLGPNNTSITGLTADCGLTLYSFTWIPPAGITDVANSRFNFLLETFA